MRKKFFKINSYLILFIFITLISQTKNVQATINPDIVSALETSLNSTISTSDINIVGWVASKNNIKDVQIYINNELEGKADFGYYRKDIGDNFKEYNNAYNSGFVYKIDMSKKNPGKYKLDIKITDKDNNVYELQNLSKDIYYKVSKESKISIENPYNDGSVQKENVDISGWAINPAGIEKIQLYIDNKFVKDLSYGYERKDIYKAYNSLADTLKSGYAGNVNIQGYSGGEHTFKVIAVGKDGSLNESIRKMYLNMSSLDPKSGMDFNTNKLAYDNFSVTGWAVNSSNISKVKVFINWKYVGDAELGFDRTDIGNIFKEYPNSKKSGFKYNIDTTKLSNGYNVIMAQAIGNDGSIDKSNNTIKNIYVSNKEILYGLDNKITSLEDNQNFDISGWALSAQGIDKIKMYIDWSYVGDASYGYNRHDIANKLSQFNNSNSGFSYSLNSRNLTQGTHTLMVQVISKCGAVKSNYYNFEVQKKKKLIVIDPGHNQLGDGGAVAEHNNVKYSETDLNMESAVKLQTELLNRGYNVVMTRQPWESKQTSTWQESVRNKVAIANNLKADLLISLHHNSLSSNITGVSVYYSTYKPGLKDVQEDLIDLTSSYDGYTDTRPTNESILSRELAKNVVNALASKCAYNKTDSDQGRIGYIDRGLMLTKESNVPSVLIELGYISNSYEATRCKDADEQVKKARVIAEEVSKLF